MLETITQVISATLSGKPPRLEHSARWRSHLRLVAVVMNVVAVESWIHGLAEQFQIALPDKMPAPGNPSKMIQASLEYRARYLLRISKKNLKYFRLTRRERGQVLRNVNDSFRSLTRAIKLRNQVAHGKTFYSVSKAGKIRHHLSRRIRDIETEQLKVFHTACRVFREFCQWMINPDSRILRSAGRVFLGYEVGVPIPPLRLAESTPRPLRRKHA